MWWKNFLGRFDYEPVMAITYEKASVFVNVY